MAFTGTPVVKQVTDRQVRITGVSLAQGASGVIVLHPFTTPPGGAVVLPVGFQPHTYEYANVPGLVTLQDSISVLINVAATNVAVAVPIAVVKTGTLPTDFTITVTNPGIIEDPNSAALEIYIFFHD
jgi:hypothetical protein